SVYLGFNSAKFAFLLCYLSLHDALPIYIIKTFQNVGYVLDEDLFVVNYDWRVMPGPVDNNFDGHIDGISAASITSRQFKYGVDRSEEHTSELQSRENLVCGLLLENKKEH